MVEKIERDYRRFKEIVKGTIRRDLKKYLTRGELIGKKGKDKVSIPVPQIELPRFVHGSSEDGEGVGQGEGKEGDAIGRPQDSGTGPGKAGDKPGEHVLEVDVTLEELAEILGEELHLPRIKPKGERSIMSKRYKYSTISMTGPESLKHFKRTFKKALLRQIVSGEYDMKNPIIIPIKEDTRYRSFKIDIEPKNNAVIFYLMDVSGSMGEEQKEIVRIESFWLDTWIRRHYDGIVTRYIIHDAKAREVDENTFFRTKESGGTLISTAYELCASIIKNEYPANEWNIYVFHFSDGDNWSTADNQKCVKILKNDLLPVCNLFGYGQVRSPYGTGEFKNVLTSNFPDAENLVISEIPDKEGIIKSIKEFLQTGR